MVPTFLAENTTKLLFFTSFRIKMTINTKINHVCRNGVNYIHVLKKTQLINTLSMFNKNAVKKNVVKCRVFNSETFLPKCVM
jgi:hypothetical protein